VPAFEPLVQINLPNLPTILFFLDLFHNFLLIQTYTI
jgi:hypothetical protein